MSSDISLIVQLHELRKLSKDLVELASQYPLPEEVLYKVQEMRVVCEESDRLYSVNL